MSTTAMLFLADIDVNGHMDWSGGWWIVMVLGMILFWGLLIFGAVWLVRDLGSHRGRQDHRAETDPLAILDRRLAEGAISSEEYRQRRQILSGTTDGE